MTKFGYLAACVNPTVYPLLGCSDEHSFFPPSAGFVDARLREQALAELAVFQDMGHCYATIVYVSTGDEQPQTNVNEVFKRAVAGWFSPQAVRDLRFTLNLFLKYLIND